MTISVVIPTLDEAPRIAETVAHLIRSANSGPQGTERAIPQDADRAGVDAGVERSAGEIAQGVGVNPAAPAAVETEVEVIVVDGGSGDATCQRARDAGARVLETPNRRPGRARQLQLGSEQSTGDVILFLHADTRLAPGWREAVERALSDPACAGGAFAFRFAERGSWERWIEWWVARRVAILELPYGDQALFMRRSVLEKIGGVPNVPIMEDLDLVSAIKREGRLAQLALTATTSSRRYRSAGPLRTLVWHQVALLGWALGWDRARLAARMGR